MADNKNKQNVRDKLRVDPNDNNELSYLQEKLGVSREQVRAAVEPVGNDSEKVRVSKEIAYYEVSSTRCYPHPRIIIINSCRMPQNRSVRITPISLFVLLA
jgi:hypothetical protein